MEQEKVQHQDLRPKIGDIFMVEDSNWETFQCTMKDEIPPDMKITFKVTFMEEKGRIKVLVSLESEGKYGESMIISREVFDTAKEAHACASRVLYGFTGFRVKKHDEIPMEIK